MHILPSYFVANDLIKMAASFTEILDCISFLRHRTVLVASLGCLFPYGSTSSKLSLAGTSVWQHPQDLISLNIFLSDVTI